MTPGIKKLRDKLCKVTEVVHELYKVDKVILSVTTQDPDDPTRVTKLMVGEGYDDNAVDLISDLAFSFLSTLYKSHAGDPEDFEEHTKEIFAEALEGFIQLMADPDHRGQMGKIGGNQEVH